MTVPLPAKLVALVLALEGVNAGNVGGFTALLTWPQLQDLATGIAPITPQAAAALALFTPLDVEDWLLAQSTVGKTAAARDAAPPFSGDALKTIGILPTPATVRA